MNRKLINGLLLLTVATGGVGTFTSCKDDSYVDPIENQQTLSSLIKLIDAELQKKQDAGDYAAAADLKVVKDKLNALLDAGLLTTENQKYLEDLIENNQNYAAGLKTYIDEMVISLITNVEIQEVYNPAFGTINLPLGIQSTLLANYHYKSDHAVVYPRIDDTSYVYGDKGAQEALDDYLADTAIKGDAFNAGTELKGIDRLGEIYVTINPSNIPEDVINGLDIKLWTSNGKQMLAHSAKLKAVKDDDHLINFGYTRANDNGFYRIEVSASAEDIEEINLEIDDRLKETAKDFINNPSKSDLANLAEAIYKQFNNRIPALALSFTPTVETSFTYESTPWNQAPGGLVIGKVDVVKDENGNDQYVSAGGTVTDDAQAGAATEEEVASNFLKLRHIYTRYAIGAVTYHPLGFSFDPEGYVPDRRLPQIGHIQEYVNRVFDKVNFELKIDGLDPEDYEIDLSDVEFKVDPTSIQIELKNVPVYKGEDKTGPVVGYVNETITLGYDGEKIAVPGDNDTALNDLVNSIVEAVNGEGDDSFVAQIQSQVTTQLRQIIMDINEQLDGINTQISDKIQSVKDEINNELNGRLGDGINRLIDLYNKVAQKVNSILDDPNAYMQVYAAYRDGNGDLHHFSNVESDPSVFTPGTGDAITMFLTSYNGELLAPAYKKYVAVVEDLTDGSDVNAINSNAEYLNTVLEGRQQKVYLPVGGANGMKAGHTYKVVYTALDYRGYISARNFYVRIAK